MTNRIAFALHLGNYPDAQKWRNLAEQEITAAGRLTPEGSDYLARVQRRIDGCGVLSITAPESVPDIIVFATKAIGERIFLDQDKAIARSKPPIFVEPVKTGFYVAMATLADGSIMSYAIHVGHGESKAVEIELPDTTPDGMVFVPGGPFFYGGEDSRFYRRHERTLPSFFIKKHEVTVAEYLEFWKSLDDRNLRNAYRSRIQFSRNEREFHNGWNDEGRLEDDRLIPGFPVVGISLDAAKAFCEWKGGQTGFTVRLPTAEEWEKAARGVDGRRYVWGDGFHAAFALTKKNEKGKAKYPLWAPPGKFPHDSSIYNVQDMAGNVREMTTTLLPGSDEFYQLKGGSASTPENFLPCSNSSDTPVVPSDVGFRYVMEMPKKK